MENSRARSECPDTLQPGRLWSLWDVAEKIREIILTLGQVITFCGGSADWEEVVSEVVEMARSIAPEKAVGMEERLQKITDRRPTIMADLLPLCDDLDLQVSRALIRQAAAAPLATAQEYSLIRDAVKAETRSKLIICLRANRASYYQNENILTERAASKFPACHRELVDAGNCLALGQSTASVFHAMRAAELATRALAEDLGVSFPFPLELAEMHNILDRMEAKILEKKKLAKSADKHAQLKFYSEAAAQFRYFKDAWRVRVAHASKRSRTHRRSQSWITSAIS